MSTRLSDYFQNYNMKEVKEKCISSLEKSEVDFVSIIYQAKELTMEYAEGRKPHYIQRNNLATEMYSNIIGLLYDNYPHLMRYDKKCAQPYLQLAGDILVYLKKLDNKYVPNNTITQKVRKMRAQQLFNEEDQQIQILWIGYVLQNDDWFRDLKGVYVSYTNEYYPLKAEWSFDLSKLRRKSIFASESSIPEDSEELLVKIPSKGKNRDGLKKVE